MTATTIPFPAHRLAHASCPRQSPADVLHGIFSAPGAEVEGTQDTYEFEHKLRRLFELLGKVRGRPLSTNERDEVLGSLFAAKRLRAQQQFETQANQ